MNEAQPKTEMQLIIEALAKKRRRLTPTMRAWALLNGWKLRGRGRPRKAAPKEERNGE
jgi:hypothetical protein